MLLCEQVQSMAKGAKEVSVVTAERKQNGDDGWRTGQSSMMSRELA